MPNPFFTATSTLVWDPDINPEGLAERLSFPLNDRTTVFGNFAQTIYAENNPDSTSNNLGFNCGDAYLLGYQVGVEQKFKSDMSLKAAASYYSYEGTATGTLRRALYRAARRQPGRDQRSLDSRFSD